jgi:hypothetical protein
VTEALMKKPWSRVFILLGLLAGCATEQAPKPLPADLNIIMFVRNLYFQAAEGSDTVLPAGQYRLALAGTDALAFQTSDGRTIAVGAKAFSHDLPVRQQVAMLIPRGEDDHHVVLLLENGSGLDAVGSSNEVRSRATVEPLQATNIQLAAQVQPQLQAMGFLDPCLGATTATTSSALPQLASPISSAAQTRLEIAGQTGGGPIPDITDWIPRGRVAGGSDIRVQGRNLDPNSLVLRLGDVALTRTGQAPGEVRFRAPAGVDMNGRTLVVYHIGGQPRTLDPVYKVFDPVVRVSRVSPASFKEGDIVTVCGNTLFNATFITPSASLQSQFIGVGDKAVAIMEPAVSPTGDRMSFRVLRAAETFVTFFDTSSGMSTYGLRTLQPQPASLSGPFKLKLAGFASASVNPLQDHIIPAAGVTWQPAPLMLRTAYHEIRFSPLKVPFVIVTEGSSGPILRQISFEGTGLSGASLKIGTMGLNPSIGLTGFQGAAVLPANASNGKICASKDNQTVCSPETIQLIGGPTIVQKPAMPLAMFVANSIDGINLAPVGITGLAYEFRMSGARAADSGAQACNTVMQVVEHSPQRIRFTVGDSSRAVPANCLTTTIFNTAPPQYVMQLIAKYGGVETVLWEQPYGLKKPTTP